jgi:serpin B
MIRKLIIIGFLLVMLGGTAAQAHPQQQDEPGPLVDGNNAFALDLYRAVRSDNENIIFSPYSISSALAMLYAGARGDTEQQMAHTLHFDLPQEQVAQAFYQFNQSLPVGAPRSESEYLFETQLNIANALWVLDAYPIRPEYTALLEQYFGAGLEALDFANAPDESRHIINDWVSEQTQDRITDLLPNGSISPLTRLVLTNAIYFKAAWQTTFNVGQTEDAVFTLLDGSQVMVPMMDRSSIDAHYAEGDGYQAVQLSYQDVGSMVIILPESGRFEEVESMLDSDQLNTIMESLEYFYVHVIIPRFEFETDLNLGDTLAILGMHNVFTPDADFSGIVDPAQTEEPLFVDAVLHKAYIAVNEEGTEAAGATAVGLGGGPGPEDAPNIFRADRPFIFLIMDQRERPGAILFLGCVLNPAQ